MLRKTKNIKLKRKEEVLRNSSFKYRISIMCNANRSYGAIKSRGES